MYVQRDIFHKRDWCSQLGLGSLARTRLSRVFERPHTLWHLCYCPVPCSAFGKRSKVEEKPGCAQQHRSWHSLKIVFSSDTSVWQRWKHIRILRIFVMTRKFSHRYLFVFLYISRKPLRKEFFFFFFLKLCSFGCLLPRFLPHSKGSLTPCDILTRQPRLLTFTSGVAFSTVSVASQGLFQVWRCEFLNQACSDQVSYTYTAHLVTAHLSKK